MHHLIYMYVYCWHLMAEAFVTYHIVSSVQDKFGNEQARVWRCHAPSTAPLPLTRRLCRALKLFPALEQPTEYARGPAAYLEADRNMHPTNRSFWHCDFHHLWNNLFRKRPVSSGISFNAFNALKLVVCHLVEDTPTTRTSAESGFHIHWRSL